VSLEEDSKSDASQRVRLSTWFVLTVIVALACEVGARLDDLFFEGIPFSAAPTFEGLFIPGPNGVRLGRPNAQWKKVRLNSFGFRSPEIPKTPPAGCERWMFLGASETFGEPSVANTEYPAKLRSLLDLSSCTEIVNTAFPGLGPPFLPAYYRAAVAQYAPTKVFFYPSTHLYLGGLQGRKKPPTPPVTPNAAPIPVKPAISLAAIVNSSRVLERLHDSLHMPGFIQKRRLEKWIANAAANKPDDWRFAQVPDERLEFMLEDLRELIDAIRASGAEPILMTHAIRATYPPRAEDRSDLFAMRAYVPQASEEVLAEFEYIADDKLRELAAATNARLIDVARLMDGKRDRFIDLVHFSSQGHADVAQLIKNEMDKHAAAAR